MLLRFYIKYFACSIISCRSKAVKYFKGNLKTPYYSQQNQAEYTVNNLVKMLKLEPDKRTWKERPIACQENAAFVVDTSKLSNFNDYRFDDLGSFLNNGYNS